MRSFSKNVQGYLKFRKFNKDLKKHIRAVGKGKCERGFKLKIKIEEENEEVVWIANKNHKKQEKLIELMKSYKILEYLIMNLVSGRDFEESLEILEMISFKIHRGWKVIGYYL